MEKFLIYAALALSALAFFRKPSTTVVETGGASQGVSLTLGNAPVFNFVSRASRVDGNGKYMGANYPPFNSCGCGRPRVGVEYGNSTSPVFASAIQMLPGVKAPLPVGGAAQVDLLSNGEFV